MATPVYIGVLVIIVPADGLEPCGARPSAGMMLTANLIMIYFFKSILILLMILYKILLTRWHK